jgi:Mrp family chromosome partitioning ATPase/capsular polysaccharide biosynthesis protein
MGLNAHAAERRAGEYPDLARVASLVGRWWFALLAAAVAAGALAAMAGSGTKPIYQAQARLLVGPLDGKANDLRAAGQQAQTLSQLATSRPVLAGTRERLGRAGPPDLAEALRADATGATRVLVISAKSADPATAARTANATAAELQELMHDPGSTLARGSALAGGRLRLIDPARVPEDALGTGLKPLVASAALAGLLGALAVVLLADYFRGRIGTEAELQEVAGVPHLGTAGRPARPRGRLAAERPDSDAAAGYRMLAGRVALSAPGLRRNSVVVTAVQRGERSGRVAADLAAAMASSGMRVILVDADQEGAEATRLFRLEGRPGLGELLDQPLHARSRMRLSRAAVECSPGMRVLPRGSLGRHDSLAPERAERALERLARAADVIVVSAGPAGASAAALIWARLVDGTLVVARRGHTRRDAVTGAIDALEQVGATVLGTVLAERAPGGFARLRPPIAAMRQRLGRLRAPAAPDPQGAGGLSS